MTASSSDDLTARSIQIGNRSARLIALSEAARARLHTLSIPGSPSLPEPAPAPAPAADPGADASLSRQMTRGHVLVVNSDPAFLDVARVLLQREHYNVTTTNLVSETSTMVHASGAQALIIDLAAGEAALWALVDDLVTDEGTRALPVIFTATDAQVLEAAETRSWPTQGCFHLLKPFDPTLLADIVHALIGPA